MKAIAFCGLTCCVCSENQGCIGVKSLRKAVTVALYIVSITFAFIEGMCIPLDINVVSWWICFSVGLNLIYHSCCNNNCY